MHPRATFPISTDLPTSMGYEVEGQSSRMMVEEDEIPKVDDSDLKDMSISSQLYLISKMLVEVVLLKLIL